MKKKGLDTGEQKLIDSVDQVGWHVMKVLEDDKGPGFAYSIGLYKTFNHPEIIIVGLKLDLAHILINDIGEDIKKGLKFESGKFYDNILDDFKCLLLNVNKEFYKEYVGYGRWYY